MFSLEELRVQVEKLNFFSNCEKKSIKSVLRQRYTTKRYWVTKQKVEKTMRDSHAFAKYGNTHISLI